MALCRTGETPLENSAGQRNALLLAPARLWQELVYVGCDRLVQVKLFMIQPEGDRVRMAVGEKPLTVDVAEVFLQSAECPRTVFSETENVAPNLARTFTHPSGLRKKVGIDEPDKMTESVIIPVMWRSGRSSKWSASAARRSAN